MLNVTEYSQFKSQAKSLGAAFKDKGYNIPHSVLLESLAISKGFANLATLKAHFEKEFARIVPLNFDDANGQYVIINVEGILYTDEDGMTPIWSWCVFNDENEGIRLEEILDAPIPYWDMMNVLTHSDKIALNHMTMTDYTECVVTGYFCSTPSIQRYGLPNYASYDEEIRTESLLAEFPFKVVKNMPLTKVDDRNDDGDVSTFFEVWVPNKIIEKFKLGDEL